MPSDFWARKAAEHRPQAAPVQRSDGPWWAQGTRLVPGPTQPPAEPAQTVPDQSEGHDFSKAMHRKQDGLCPGCGGDNYFKPSATAAARCFECGYVESRDVHTTPPMSVITEGPARQAKQVPGAGLGNNFHGGQSAREINEHSAQLERSALGKGNVG